MATYYVDGLNGNDANAGTSFAAAFLTIAKAAATVADGGKVIICATTTYTLTVTVTWSTTGTAANGGIIVVGGDALGNELGPTGTPPVITSSTVSLALFTLSAVNFYTFKYLKFTHTATTRGNAFVTAGAANSTPLTLRGVVIDGALNGIAAPSRSVVLLLIDDCLVQNCTSVGLNLVGTTSLYVRDTTVYNNASDGLLNSNSTGNWNVVRCIVAKNGGKGINDTGTTRVVTFEIDDCAIVDNTSDGIGSAEATASAGTFTIVGRNNIIWGNGGYGVNVSAQVALNTDARKLFNHNFYGSNTASDFNGLSTDTGDVTGLPDPFVNRAGQNWGLNNTTGAGALVRAAGFPGAFRGTSTTGHLDGGAVQHQDAGGGGAPIIGSAIVRGLGRAA